VPYNANAPVGSSITRPVTFLGLGRVPLTSIGLTATGKTIGTFGPKVSKG
jgi:hypothetical protein